MAGNSKKRIFIRTDETVMIEEIKKRPVLYDISQKDYKRQASRQQAWIEVAAAIDLSVEAVKKRWRSLRDAFIKHIRHGDETLRGTMLHYDLMEFLTPYVSGDNARRRSVVRNPFKIKLETYDNLVYITEKDEPSMDENIMDEKVEEEYLLEEQMNLDEPDQFVDLNSGEEIDYKDYKVIVKKRKLDEPVDVETYHQSEDQPDTYTIEDKVYCPSEEIAKPNDMSSDEQFLLSLAPAMKRLSQKKNGAARIKIQQLLFELEYDEKYE